MADDLRLKVSSSEYGTRYGILQAKLNELETIYHEYAQLKLDANKVLGDGDTNLDQLMQVVERNMKAVEGQQKLLAESMNMLQKQNDELGLTSSTISQLLTQAMETAKTGFNTIKIIGDLVT